jgi:diguanylate cyclase (GGDEF)-like protein
MKRWGIKGQVLFLALMPAAVIAMVLAFYFTSTRIADLERTLQERGVAIARQLTPAAEYGVVSGNWTVLRGLADAAAQEADVTAVVISDSGGNILASSGEPSPQLMRSLARPVTLLEAGQNADKLLFAASIHLVEAEVDDLLVAGQGVNGIGQQLPGKIVGRASVELSRKATVERKNLVLRDSLLIALLGLAVSALFALRMSRVVTVPISKLVGVVERIGKGNLEIRVNADFGGEFALLENGINDMALALKSAHENLQDRIIEATAKLTYQASHDALTGLVNRREFELRTERALLSARQMGRVHALCYMDLDQFKVVNDTCGHIAGDELLRQFTTMWQPSVRDRDTLARLGGDEFGVLLENCPLDKAFEVAELLRQTAHDFRFVWQEKSFLVGVSIGLVVIDQNSESVVNLLSCADAACYAAKDKGRNRIHVYQPTDDRLVQRHGEMQWVSRISQALEENRFRLYCQRISSLHAELAEQQHFEILVRMIDETGQMVLPMAFIPAAERYLLMPAVDRWVIGHVFELCSQMGVHERMAGSTCTINLSGASLSDENFLVFVQEQFRLFQVPPSFICFEITETAAISNLTDAIALMRALKQIGCRFSLDDFGSGLSSFTYLKHLPVDYLKIDGSFVKDMANDPIDYAMVQSINNIGQLMGLQTIAEFVESEAVMHKLKEVGVDFAQGVWIDEPKPFEGFLRSAFPAS